MSKDRKPHIGIFGRRNHGKSTLINMLLGQEISIVSELAGTTTDPVKKSLEIMGLGAVVLIDTAGIDDVGELGQKRILKTYQTLKNIDFAILLIAHNKFGNFETELIENFHKHKLPFIVIHNKEDLEPICKNTKLLLEQANAKEILQFSAIHGNVEAIVQSIKTHTPKFTNRSLLGNIISYRDIVLLVTPIDIEAPEGRLILPQVQAIRDILDHNAICIVLKEHELNFFLNNTKIQPKLVITDSQAFKKVETSIPKNLALTGFSILLAHFKGNFKAYLEGTPKISKLKNGDKILLLESCSHHTSCDDIGRVKIPRWISSYTGKQLEFTTVAGLDEVPEAISNYALVIQCGACVITQKQLSNRLQDAIDAGVSVTNYGMAIAYVQGIYNRAIEPFIGKMDFE